MDWNRIGDLLRRWNREAEDWLYRTGVELHAAAGRAWRQARARRSRATAPPASAAGEPSQFRRELYALADRVDARMPTPRSLALLVAGVFVVDVLLWQTCGLRGCPDVEALVSYQPGGATVLLDRRGERFADLSPFDHTVVALATLPEHVPQAFIAVEDQRFYEHNGVDWRRVVGAALANLRARGVEQGSSTITMQLARNLFSDRVRARERTMRRKLLEVRVAREIERRYEKDEILELYLNHIYFGGGAYGIESASRYWFGKSAKRLDLDEAALLAALPKAPSHYDPRRRPERAKARRNLVLDLMEAQARIPAERASRARSARLGVTEDPPRRRGDEEMGRYFIEHVRRIVEDAIGERAYREKLQVHTTLDAVAQRAADQELVRQLAAIERGAAGRFTASRYRGRGVPDSAGTDYLQGAVVVMDARTGDVRALVGGRDFDDSRYDRATRARRQAGSAFKPFVFATALAARIPASQPIRDQPLRIENDGTIWEPENYDGEFRGSVSLRDALVHSINVPSIRLAAAVGPENVAQVARAAGVKAELRETPMIALGIAEVSPLELTMAFTTFATLGERVGGARFVTRIEDANGALLWESEPAPARRVLDPGVAYITTHILMDAVQRGTGTAVRAAGFRGPVAGKTGTTNDATDAWFVGMTPELVTTVWIGFDSRRPIAGAASGGRAAAPVAGRILRRIYARRGVPDPWLAPGNVRILPVDPESGRILADGCVPAWGVSYNELFLEDAIPPVVCPREEFIDFWDRIGNGADRIFGGGRDDRPRRDDDLRERDPDLGELRLDRRGRDERGNGRGRGRGRGRE